MKNNYDVIVVGGGIIGSAVTYYLSQESLKVCVLEKAGIATGTTGATMGNLSLHNRVPGPWFDLALKTWDIYSHLQEKTGCDVEFSIVGSLMLIREEENIVWAKNRVAIQREAGLEVEFVAKEDIKRLDPEVSNNVAGAVYSPMSAHVNPFLLCRAFLQAARANGAVIATHTPVTGCTVVNGKIRSIETPRGVYHAPVVIIAAGAWSGEVGQLLSVNVPVEKNIGTILIVENFAGKGTGIKGECTDGVSDIDKRKQTHRDYDVHFVFTRTPSGNCLLGRSGIPFKDHSGVDYNAVQAISERATLFLPQLGRMHIIRCFTGIRPFSPDRLPQLGAIPSVSGVYLACGFGDKGVGSGAYAAYLLSRSILTQNNRIIPSEFNPNRFE
jgi:sarcosine oxidase subunit beta